MKSIDRAQYGDFQTPVSLAKSVCTLLLSRNVQPTHVLEPTCGRGAFLTAAAEAFPHVRRLFGVEIDPVHFHEARRALDLVRSSGRTDLYWGDFFRFDWERIFSAHAGKWLIIGNPPWVTSSALASMSSDNLPKKSNFDGLKGMEARTGKSNFDISEWMLLQHLDFLKRHGGWLAMLTKSNVARKLLGRCWRGDYPVKYAAMHSIDAASNFGVSVDACLLFLEMEQGHYRRECEVFGDLSATRPSCSIATSDGYMVANLARYRSLKVLLGPERDYQWRSGVKHDCSKIMEFTRAGKLFRNGLGQEVQLEEELIYPLLKSSDVANGRLRTERCVLITQKRMGEDTSLLRSRAPLAWGYLENHADTLRRRGSSIYRNRPPFSIFGIGDYSFAPWKIAISGFYKSLNFSVVEPSNGRPVLFDDTVYFLACGSQAEARFLGEILNSEPARDFLNAMVFWSDKRPITVDLLKRLSLSKLADYLGRGGEYERLAKVRSEQNQSALADLRLRA